MQVMKGNKYEITMFVWFEKLAKAEKRLSQSIECQNKFGDHEEWVEKDTKEVENIKSDIEEVKSKLQSKGIFLDYNKINGEAMMSIA